MSPSIKHTSIAYLIQPQKIFIAFRYTRSHSFLFLLFSFPVCCFFLPFSSFLISPIIFFYYLLFSFFLFPFSSLLLFSLLYSSLLLSLISIFVFLSPLLFSFFLFLLRTPLILFRLQYSYFILFYSTLFYFILFYFIHYSFSHLVTLKLRTIINTLHVNVLAYLALAVSLSSPPLQSPLLHFKLSLSVNQPSHPSYRAPPLLQFRMLRPRYTRLKWGLMI